MEYHFYSIGMLRRKMEAPTFVHSEWCLYDFAPNRFPNTNLFTLCICALWNTKGKLCAEYGKICNWLESRVSLNKWKSFSINLWFQDGDLSIKSLNRTNSFGVVLDSRLPHLICMDDDMLNTGIVLYQLKVRISSMSCFVFYCLKYNKWVCIF